MTSDDPLLQELDRAIDKFLGSNPSEYQHWPLTSSDKLNEAMLEPLELQRSIRQHRDYRRLQILALVESKTDAIRFLLLDLLHRWRRDEVVEADLPSLLMLNSIDMVRIASAMRDDTIVFDYRNPMPWNSTESTEFHQHPGPLPPLAWNRGERPTHVNFLRRSHSLKLILNSSLDIRIAELAKADHTDWIAAFEFKVDQVSFSTVAQYESLINHEAVAGVDADAQYFDDTFDLEGERLTPEELHRGIDRATADMDWALNLLGPPPAPTGKSSGAPTPVKPLGSTS